MPFYLSTQNQKETYALETLLILIGIVPKEIVVLHAGNKNEQNTIKQRYARVVFLKPQRNDLEFSCESTIIENILFLKSNILDIICLVLGQQAHDQFHMLEILRARSKASTNKCNFRWGVAFLDRSTERIKLIMEKFFKSRSIAWDQLNPWDRPVICLTHDVDSIKGKSFFRYLFWLGYAALHINPVLFRNSIKKIKYFMSLPEDPHFSFLPFAGLEERYGFKSTFFLMSLPFFLGKEGRRYSLNNAKLRLACRDLSQRGWEIGIHPTRKSHKNEAALRIEKDRLLSFLDIPGARLGVRNHYLKASFPETWRIQENVGILYDSSVGFSSRPGFPAGTCRPYQPFDLINNRSIDLWELPLSLMDGSVSGTTDEIVNTCKEIAEECFRRKGVFVLLWHSNRFHPSEYPEFEKAYRKICEYFAYRGCTGFTAREIVDKYAKYCEIMKQSIKIFPQNEITESQ
jgi:hypothetical protein